VASRGTDHEGTRHRRAWFRAAETAARDHAEQRVVEINGPSTPEEKRLWDRAPEALKKIDANLEELAELDELLPESRRAHQAERKQLLQL
jgi:hypothetical protein